MMYDATEHVPAEPLLANALKQSVALTLEEGERVQGLMEGVRADHGNLAQGTLLVVGDEAPYLFYLAPEILQQNREIIEAIGNELADSLAKAGTAEQQEAELLAAMREMLDISLMYGGNPQAVHTFLATIDGIFEEYEKAGEPMSETLEDMHERISYYGGIVSDALVASEALLVRYQRHEDIPEEKMLRTPYALAFKRDLQRNPVVIGTPERVDKERDICNEADTILYEMTKDYYETLPFHPRIDMLALVLRCSERLHDIEAHKLRARHERIYNIANDNDLSAEGGAPPLSVPTGNIPINEVALFDDPMVRRRTKQLLGQVFLKHPDASESPKALMEAVCSLEDVLMLEERRADREQGR
jgi:hypothetical protein